VRGPRSASDALHEALQVDLREAAERGDAAAQLQLGYLHSQGHRLPRDDREALRWFLAAAEQGHPEAQRCVALSCFKGLGVDRDVRRAYFWMVLADERDPDCGVLAEGVGFADLVGIELTAAQRDAVRAEARDWTSRSDAVLAAVRQRAERGDVDAQRLLAGWLATGCRVPKDGGAGFAWLLQAAERGDPEAQFGVGFGFLTGRGVAADTSRAYFWLVLASARDPRGEEIRDAVGDELPAEQRDAVRAEARGWTPRT